MLHSVYTASYQTCIMKLFITHLKGNKMAHLFRISLIFILLVTVLHQSQAAIRYVKPVASGLGDGSSWANASSDLQLMMNLSAADDEVWVAAGTYLPNRRADDITGPVTMNNRDNAFMLKVDVKLYGGFVGTETLLSQRNWITNQTILSGDIGVAGNPIDNCYHVVVSAGHVGNALLDGFTVTAGNTSTNTNLTNKLIINSQDIYRYRGGGIYISGSSPNISNCKFTLNTANGGGAVYVAFTPSPVFFNCTINQNNAPAGGAGVFNVESNPQYINCVVSNNISVGGYGGGVFNFKSPSTIINTLFYANSGSYGGAVMNEQSSATLINCTVSKNNALSAGGGVANLNAVAPIINNSIIWGNSTGSAAPNIYIAGGNPNVNNSIVQGGWIYAGTNNIDSYPFFVEESANNYRLEVCSPAVNAGNNSLVPVTITTDLDANPRIINTLVDIGAYESELTTITAVPNGSGVIFVDHTKTGNGSSWANAMTELADALIAAKYDPSIQQIWVAKGTYKPQYNEGGLGLCKDTLNRYNAFVLRSGVALYGGFNGTELLLNQRNWLLNETILSGDIGISGYDGDNAYHVVISAGSGAQILDGFVVTKGSASLANNKIIVNHVTVESFRGGGIAVSDASPVISNCAIKDNYGLHGGGMSVIGSSPEINHCIFTGNRAQTYGGAIDHFRNLTGQISAAIINNTHFSGNRSFTYGGAFVNTSPSTMLFNNCTMTGNYANAGGASYSYNGFDTFNNCIVWDNIASTPNTNNLHRTFGNATASNCIIQGGYPGVNIINANPAFVNPMPAISAPTMDGDYRLQICSPAINAGNNSLVPVSITTDLDRDPRIVNTTVDIGAYEFQTSNVKAVPNGSGIVFVDQTKTGNGSSWANAVPELADALRAARSNPSIQQIWVAKGTYYPLYEPVGLSCTPDDNREKTFLLVNNVKVYGGFAGGEASIAGRDFLTNETILSGDIGILNNTADNVYHVVTSAGAVGTAELNGFTVTKGNANFNKTLTVNTQVIDSRLGGGIVCFNSSPLITNCIFSQNNAELSGGGIYMYAGTGTTFSNCTLMSNFSGNGGGVYISDVSTLTNFTNCNFTGNTASNGGGVYVNASNTRFTNSVVSGNSAVSGGGGMYFLASVNVSVINCLIAGNKAAIGGGVRSGSSAPRFDNCTVSGNNATSSGSGLYFTIAPASSQPFIYNSIVYFNRLNGVTVDNIVTASGGANATPDVYYSIIGNTGGYDNMGNNNNADPLFINPQSALLAPTSAGNYALQACSPAVNTGNNAYIPGGITTDIVGNNRIQNVTVDRGAYEISLSDPVTPNGSGIVFVDKTKNGNGSSWANAASELADALKAASSNSSITQIWVAKGTYYPLYHASTLLCSPAIDRDRSFVLVNNVKVYGGFEGGEILLSQRNPALHETILSGDIGVLGIHNDNAFHVVISTGTVGSAEIHGFTIQDGRADSTGSLTINSISVSRNNGGGLHIATSAPAVTNCKLLGNSCSNTGGGIFTSSSSTVFTNCLVTGNSSNGLGGGIYSINNVVSTQFYQCTFSGNKGSNGGGIYIAGFSFTSAKLYNCISYGNQTNVGGLNNDLISVATIDPEVRYSNIGNTAAVGSYNSVVGNSTINPLFVAPQSATLAPTLLGNYRLQKCSPAINTGSNTFAPAGNELDNNPRIAFGNVDRGAYEKILGLPGGSGILYVNKSNPISDGDGSSWEQAIHELGDALLAAQYNSVITEIWVAKGTYYPLYDPVNFSCSPADNREKTFLLVNNVKVYGGFAGNEVDIAERDFIINETILSGDLGVLNNNTDNAYHVVVGAGNLGTAQLNGFTITRGNANQNITLTVNGQPVNARLGGGVMLYSSAPFITNCIISNNVSSLDGGGMYIGVTSAGVSIADCVFKENSSINGGGFHGTTISTSLILRDCFFNNNSASNGAGAYFNATVLNMTRGTFSGNTASAGGGGIFIINSVTATINNSLFSGNMAQTGGAVRSAASSPRFNNCTVAGNNCSSSGGGLYFINAPASGQPLIYNSIVYGNRLNGVTVNNIITQSGGATATPDAAYCMVENVAGYDDAGNNLTSNPLFINPQSASLAPTQAGNYRLQKCSPAINSGFNTYAPISNDLDSNPRIAFTTVDRGAYEKVLAIPATNAVVYVDSSNVTGEGDGSSWSKAVTQLGDALKAAKTNPAITQIWVANGTYYPIYNATDNGSSLTCPSVNRDNSFVLVNNVKVYGGFAGGEADTTGRDFLINETILSGDFNKDDVITGSGATLSITGNAENAIHTLICAGSLGSAEVNGFTITKGNADIISGSISVNGLGIPKDVGGGAHISNLDFSPTNIINCKIVHNAARSFAGVSIYNSAAPIIMNCSFVENLALLNGGGMGFISFTRPKLSYCIFTGNYSATGSGGGIAMGSTSLSSTRISNSTFSSNAAAINGGGIYSSNADGNILNCLFLRNEANLGGGIFANNSPTGTFNNTMVGNKATSAGAGIYVLAGSNFIINNIIYGNKVGITPSNIEGPALNIQVRNSIVEGGYSHISNYDLDPLFINPLVDNYRLQSCSPAINLGQNYNVLEGGVDLDGNPRIVFTYVDLGAYEKQTADYTSSTIWRGYNTDWNNKVNWCGGFIPTDTTNVTIPTGLPNYPVTSDSNNVKNILLESGSSIGTTSTGKISIHGTYTNNGSAINNLGTLVFTGHAAAQNFPGNLGTVTAMHNLEIDNPNGMVINKPITITGSLIPSDGNIELNNVVVTLSSSANATASVCAFQPGASLSYIGAGAFTVERHINTGTDPGQHPKSWQFLATPVAGQTVFQSWQESGAAPPGYGTWLTGTGTGFDVTTLSPSMKYYDTATTNWKGITNTGHNLQNSLGYMLFVRGDRTVVTYNGTPNVTNMRSKGTIYTPSNPPPNVLVPANAFQSLGNPYPSRISFPQVYAGSTGINDVFYVWDPKLQGSYQVGGWQTMSGLVNYAPTAGGDPDTYYPAGVPNPYIESGQAVMVRGNGSGGSVVFSESNKVSGNRLVNRTQQTNYNVSGNRQFLYSSLFTSDGVIADGNIVVFDTGLSNDVDYNDATKILNDGENLGLINDQSILAVEGRALIAQGDTIFYYLKNLRQQSYQLRFTPVNMDQQIMAILIDRFTNSQMPVSLNNKSYIDFTVTSDPLSQSTGRFILVFKQLDIVPVSFISISANRISDKSVHVKWEVDNETGISIYDIERSANGRNFSQLGILQPTVNNGGTASYSFIDHAALQSDIFYRIKAKSESGLIQYSKMVKVSQVKIDGSIRVFPNPVVDGNMHLNIQGMPEGVYAARIINSAGQVVFSKHFTIQAQVQTMNFSVQLSHGQYHLEIITPEGGKILQSVMF